MPIRFRRTLRIAPGVKLNFSKSGISTTVGPKGFHYTFGKRGIRRSIGIPGTGISEVDYVKKNENEEEKEKGQRSEERREEHPAEPAAQHWRRQSRGAATAQAAPTGLRNAFVLLGIVVFFFAGAAVLGLIPAHFLSNTLGYFVRLAQNSGL
ncbi:MAG TPA: DUF4236 domain-containing protein [Anaerolineales bacterium]|nr:DUF4236 domain-containing protein [Anaerolineales bacterium]